MAKPDPALGYINGELRVWLGWAQEVAGDRAAAQESWRQARGELESFFKEQPENYVLMGDLALTNMGLGDKAAALALIEKAMAVVPIEKDALDGPIPLDILARVSAKMGEPDRAIAALQKLLLIPYTQARLRQTCLLLLPCFGSIPCLIRCGMIHPSGASVFQEADEQHGPDQANCVFKSTHSTYL
jgi:tetratricopeptide (TPR) repeat protein